LLACDAFGQTLTQRLDQRRRAGPPTPLAILSPEPEPAAFAGQP